MSGSDNDVGFIRVCALHAVRRCVEELECLITAGGADLDSPRAVAREAAVTELLGRALGEMIGRRAHCVQALQAAINQACRNVAENGSRVLGERLGRNVPTRI